MPHSGSYLDLISQGITDHLQYEDDAILVTEPDEVEINFEPKVSPPLL
jgi:hypothetical protein